LAQKGTKAPTLEGRLPDVKRKESQIQYLISQPNSRVYIAERGWLKVKD
jgi:hypothetical protein